MWNFYLRYEGDTTFGTLLASIDIPDRTPLNKLYPEIVKYAEYK